MDDKFTIKEDLIKLTRELRYKNQNLESELQKEELTNLILKLEFNLLIKMAILGAFYSWLIIIIIKRA